MCRTERTRFIIGFMTARDDASRCSYDMPEGTLKWSKAIALVAFEKRVKNYSGMFQRDRLLSLLWPDEVMCKGCDLLLATVCGVASMRRNRTNWLGKRPTRSAASKDESD